ncbi:MAG: YraN family protein [Clostridia bacterium]|nr:YraN family protein [Clostridia bacterium]
MAEKTQTQKIGDMGESAAASYLIRHGYTIVMRNYRLPCGEIDIIAKNKQYIVFAEVKTRAADALDRPSAWVDKRKQKKLIRTASVYLENSSLDLQPRFDVIEVVYDKKTKVIVSIEHIENAFIQQDDYAAF